ncbi:MAG: hypothetical protein JNJ71_04140 [Rubrivivax sp.]|nr:hypothetical protein [Rubrivivax sp.]
MSARSALLAALLTAIGLAGCSTPPPPAAERYQPPAAGSSWSYLLRSDGSFGEARAEVPVRVEETRFEGRPVLSFEAGGQRQLQDRQGGLIAVTDLQGRVQQRYEPPLGLEFPLAVGKTWTRDHTVLLAGSARPQPFRATWVVEAYETVSVPAGRFGAWRMRYSDSFGESHTVWSAPESLGIFLKRVSTRPASHNPGGAGQRTMELQSLPR